MKVAILPILFANINYPLGNAILDAISAPKSEVRNNEGGLEKNGSLVKHCKSIILVEP